CRDVLLRRLTGERCCCEITDQRVRPIGVLERRLDLCSTLLLCCPQNVILLLICECSLRCQFAVEQSAVCATSESPNLRSPRDRRTNRLVHSRWHKGQCSLHCLG